MVVVDGREVSGPSLAKPWGDTTGAADNENPRCERGEGEEVKTPAATAVKPQRWVAHQLLARSDDVRSHRRGVCRITGCLDPRYGILTPRQRAAEELDGRRVRLRSFDFVQCLTGKGSCVCLTRSHWSDPDPVLPSRDGP